MTSSPRGLRSAPQTLRMLDDTFQPHEVVWAKCPTWGLWPGYVASVGGAYIKVALFGTEPSTMSYTASQVRLGYVKKWEASRPRKRLTHAHVVFQNKDQQEYRGAVKQAEDLLADAEQSIEQAMCENCGRGDGEDVMLLCEQCDAAYHTHCLNPPLASVPDWDWLCAACAAYPPGPASPPRTLAAARCRHPSCCAPPPR